jgi:hypothetical protein
MPYIRMYNIQDEKVCELITEKVEKAFCQPRLSDEDKHSIVSKVVSTVLFDNVFELD